MTLSRPLKTLVCAHCGIDKTVPLSVYKETTKYCSRKCASEASRKPPKPKKEKKLRVQKLAVCGGCGNEFVVKSGSRGIVCSLRCWGKIKSSLIPNKPYPTGKGGKRADLGGQYFRSRWEANYARYLNLLVEKKQIISWKFEPDTFEFPVKRGTRFYTPDFKITEMDGSIVYHEVKGYLDARGATRLKRMKKYYPLVKLILIQKKEMMEIAKKISMLLPGWERDRKRSKWA